MNNAYKLIVLISVLVCLGCDSSDESQNYPYDSSPYIEFVDISFVSPDDLSGDTVKLLFTVASDTFPIGTHYTEARFFPYHPYWLIIDDNNQLVKLSGEFEKPYFRVIPPSLFREESNYQIHEKLDMNIERPPYSYIDYEVLEGYNQLNEYFRDTFFIQRNPLRLNTKIDLYSNKSGSFEKVDFRCLFSTRCDGLNFHLNLPLIDGNIKQIGDEGTIFRIDKIDQFTYQVEVNLVTSVFSLLFGDSDIKLSVSFLDRSFRESNTIFSTPIRIE